MQDIGFLTQCIAFLSFFLSFFLFFQEITCGKIVEGILLMIFPPELFISHPILQLFVTKNKLQFLILVTVV